MAVAYEKFDDIEAHSIHSTDSESRDPVTSDALTSEASGSVFLAGNKVPPRLRRMHYLMTSRWPYHTGVAHITLGLLLSLMGLIEIITLPMIYNEHFSFVTLNRHNAYGLAEWISLLTILTGMLGLGAAYRRSIHQMYAYFAMVLVELVLITGANLFILSAYGKGWSSLLAFNHNTLPFVWHIVTSLVIVAIYVMAIVTFTQYYEDVCFGELQCCKSILHCLCPCFCPRAVDRDELLEETIERPPSLPV